MNINQSTNKNICFDLQFRKDVKHKRPAKPVYYNWKAQFVILGNYQDEELLRTIQNVLKAGRLNFLKINQIRYSVQKIDDLYYKIVPYFKKNQLFGKKKKDFQLWAEAIEILFQNKGKKIKKWPKQDFLKIIEIQKKADQYKIKKIQGEKWLAEAELIAQSLPNNQ
jgi:hypothetical protein